ncbi:MAG: TolC family protein [Oculatellaceae cyanobacterium bins.114]|nr:TolC family protein [Oculatellaceae cyanobacterium bins.114]
MQPTHPLIALSIGAVIALNSVGTASAQTPPPLNSDLGLTKGSQSERDQPISGFQRQVMDPPKVDAVAVRSSFSSVQPLTKEQLEQGRDASTAPSALDRSPATANPEAIAQDLPATPRPDTSNSPSVTDAPTPTSTAAPLTESAPEYLNSDPNPLLFPTRPEEVQIIGTQPITLQQALEVARRNSRELQVSQLELERNQASLREQQAANDPTVQAGVSVNAAENQNQGQTDVFGRPVGNQDDINVTLGGTVQLDYNLFTSGRRSAAIRAAEGQVRLQELQVETTAEQLRLDVTNDYYDLQEADEQVRISQDTLEQSLRSLQDAEALERAGVGTRFDVLQAQVDVANTQQELRQRISEQQIARRQLARRLNLPETINIAAADPVQVADRWGLPLEESIILAYRNRAELQQQLVQRDISEQQRRAALAALDPQVSLSAAYNVSNLLNQDSGFEDTYELGAQVSITLFDGGAARAQADQQEANIAIAEAQFADARNQVRFEVEQSYLSLQANFENIATTALALQQATEALRLARLRFQAGVGTQTDVLRSQTELTRAEVNQLNAILGYNRSLVQLQRSVSNLASSNLGETP